MSVTGAAIHAALSAVGCPGLAGKTPEDLDWLGATGAETRAVLAWLSHSLEPELALTAEDEALDSFPADPAPSALSLAELRAEVDRGREELDLQSATLEAWSDVSGALSRAQTQLGAQLPRLAAWRESQVRSECSGPERRLGQGEAYNEALGQLQEQIGLMGAELATYPHPSGRPRLLAECDRPSMAAADERLSEALAEYFRTQMQSFESDEDVTAASELARLRTGLALTQGEQVLAQARLAGQRASLDHLSTLGRQYERGHLTTEVSALERRAEALTPQLVSLQSDLDAVQRERLLRMCDQWADCDVERVVALDLQHKSLEAEWHGAQLEVFQRWLIGQRSRQTVLAGLVHAEKVGLDALLTLLAAIQADLGGQCEALATEKVAVENLRLFEIEKAQDEIHPQDHIMSALMAMISSAQGPGAQRDVIQALQALRARTQSQVEQKRLIQKDIVSQQEQLLHDLPRTEALLNLDGWKHGTLTQSGIRRPLQSLQQGMKGFEVSVKEALSKWDQETKALKHDPHRYTQKRLWIDFLTNPKLLEANVDAMVKKAK
eukprot:maker-scaffold347_size200506-snap-gene-1.23 protein:Tk02327 transcript:maker-scaffold347_size200506-snap-gene-1.23-mRNA-1 annotation:"hypothetical protein ZEAMMB73_378778"